MKSLRIKQTVSTAYHPQTDGQTENKNAWIEQALRHFINFYQDDWDIYLHIVEHAINDSLNSTTGYTPFYLDTGRHPTSLLDLSLDPTTSLSVRQMRNVYQVVKHRIAEAQNKQAEYANRRRLEDPFKIDDYVLLSSKHFTPPNERGRPTAKFGPTYYGPYKIIAKKGTSYQLQFPFSWKAHDVFHPEKLRPYYWDHDGPSPFSSLPQARREIERYIALRTINDKLQVLVKWKNHSPVYNLWLDVTPTIQAEIDKLRKDPDFLESDLAILEAGVTENLPKDHPTKVSFASSHATFFIPKFTPLKTPSRFAPSFSLDTNSTPDFSEPSS